MKPAPVTRSELNEVRCNAVGCTCTDHPQPAKMEFRASCHQTNAVHVVYVRDRGVLVICCLVCRQPIVEVLVAGALPS